MANAQSQSVFGSASRTFTSTMNAIENGVQALDQLAQAGKDTAETYKHVTAIKNHENLFDAIEGFKSRHPNGTTSRSDLIAEVTRIIS